MLEKLPVHKSKPTIYVGCTGWSMKEWVGKVYPKGAKSKDFLRHYSRQFNTIELNTTHYRIPSLATIQTWKSTVPQDFKFAPKIPQTISHSRDMATSNDNTTLFCDAISGLENNLGCSFMQLPPYFAINRLEVLAQFLEKFPTEIPLAIEVRHESWFNDSRNLNQLFDLLEAKGISTVITDVAGRRDVLHQRLTTDTAMIRFVGNGLHPTDYERVNDWITRLKFWIEKGVKEVYFFTHEPDNLLAPELADYFVKTAMKELDAYIRGPKFHEDEGQMSLF